MPNSNPEDLEKMIHRTLRSLPDRRAPRTLESRVLAAIEAQHAQPWWQQSFTHWPLAARGAFLLLSGMVAAALIVMVFRSGPEANAVSALSGPMEIIRHIKATFAGISRFGSLVYRSIPPIWLYGSIAFLAAMYAALFGLSATAYRTFINQR